MKDNNGDNISKILKYHENELEKIKNTNNVNIENTIKDTEALLQSLGVDISKKTNIEKNKKIIYMPTWEELLDKANENIKENVDIKELFTDKELNENKEILRIYKSEFDSIYKLDEFDIAIGVIGGILGAIIDILLVGIPKKTTDGIKSGPLSNYVRDYFDKVFPKDEMENLANSKVSKVPFDAQDNRNTKVHVEGLSAYYHRLLQLGHDPILGLLFGVADILNGTMTTIDKKGKFCRQVVEEYNNRKECDIFLAITKQLIHFASDITTSMGLPAPLMSLFNFLQIGKIGEYEQTIAEIVQGMYFEGYDFIHFCSMSIPTMITEVVIRIGYALKKLKEGKSINECIPFSVKRKNNYKLSTMLFLGHTSSCAINAGKIYFTQNPLAINYSEWLMFLKCSYEQLKFGLINKPELRNKFIEGKLDNEFLDIMNSIDETFNDFTKNYIVVMS